MELTVDQIKCIQKLLDEGADGHFESCLCGYYEFHIEGLGYLMINIHCKQSYHSVSRKSYDCVDGQSWYISDIANVWSDSMVECTVNGIELIGQLSKNSLKQVKEIVTKHIINTCETK